MFMKVLRYEFFFKILWSGQKLASSQQERLWNSIKIWRESARATVIIFFAIKTRKDIKMPLCLSTLVRIVNNDHERKQKCNFSALVWECPIWADLVHKNKIVSLKWNMAFRLIQDAKFKGGVLFCPFCSEIAFLVKFGPKIPNCLKWSDYLD